MSVSGNAALTSTPSRTGRAATLDVFRHAVVPYLALARDTFRVSLDSHAPAAMARLRPVFGFEDVFESRWMMALLRLAERTLILEVNVARLRGQLAGDSPEERFHSFGRLLRDAASREAILADYPALQRALSVTARLRARADAELVCRLARDITAIEQTMGAGTTAGRVLRLASDGGDSHRGGRAVCILAFESGLQVVYKPRSLAVEAHYAAMVAWLSARGLTLELPMPALITRRGYGWSECVRHHACPDRAGVSTYYRRLGAHLAVLYALEATDLHLENVIASGAAPMLVDLEALFQPRVTSAANTGRDAVARGALLHSVLRPGLLPSAQPPTLGDRPVDRSGVGGAPGQLSPHPMLQYESAGTDTIRLSPQFIPLAASRNQPMLDGERVDAAAFTADLADGFDTAYRCLQRNRDALLAPRGPLERFAKDRVRFIARGTATYDDFLSRSTHPGALRSRADRAFVIDRLLGATGSATHLTDLRQSERFDLWRGDIPVFSATPGFTRVIDSRGRALPSPIARPPLAWVRDRIAALGPDDLTRQLSLIRGGMATLRTGTQSPPAELPWSQPHTRVAPSALVDAARACADRVARAALSEGEQHAWIGIATMQEQFWTLGQLGAHLYDGSVGIALFLGYAGDVTQERQFTTMARRVVDGLVGAVNDARRSHAAMYDIGLFTGQAGLVYLFTHLGTLWHDRALIDVAVALALDLRADIDRDTTDDLIGGAAGTLCAVLALYAVTSDAVLLALARDIGDHLIVRATIDEHGLAWHSLPRARPLAGLSHGGSGIALALSRLGRLTNDSRYLGAASDACRYERTFFSAPLGTWEDRRDANAIGSMNAWCHGAPGIALARLELLHHVAPHDVALTLDLARALHAVRTLPASDNHSICHGALGNLAALYEAGRRRGDADSASLAERWLGVVLADVRARGPRCGTPDGIEAPGLMTGLSGIGYQLLRCAAPDRVPCVLTAAAPPVRTPPRQRATRMRTTRGQHA